MAQRPPYNLTARRPLTPQSDVKGKADSYSARPLFVLSFSQAAGQTYFTREASLSHSPAFSSVTVAIFNGRQGRAPPVRTRSPAPFRGVVWSQ